MLDLVLALFWFHLCDRLHAFPVHPRQHDLRAFCVAMSVAALVPHAFDLGLGGGTTPRKHQHSSILARHQTDEWKGVMQTWILLYHYFNCTETYKVVRLFVASFSWMTGYGHCYYYLQSNDFSRRRLLKAIVRLNAFAALCCLALGNQYMLYYICPLTTLHTVMAYAIMATFPSANLNLPAALLKLLVATAGVAIVWENQALLHRVWGPFRWLLRYDGPSLRSENPMHEWYFRSSLEKYVWLNGMLFALLKGPYERLLLRLSQGPRKASLRMLQCAIVLACVVAAAAWYRGVGHLDKYAYNRVHPHTSFVPVTIFVLLRNLDPGMWAWSFGGFHGMMGASSLELCACLMLRIGLTTGMHPPRSLTHSLLIVQSLLADICQFHTWLATTRPNSQPRDRLVVLPGPSVVNFVVTTLLFLWISRRVSARMGVLVRVLA